MNLFFKTKQQIQQENEARRVDAEHRERYITLMSKIDHVADEIGKHLDLLEARMVNNLKISKKRHSKHSKLLKTKRGRKPGSKNKPVFITLGETNGTNEPQ